ncbi:MAG: hypothetical protein QOH88_2168 [Verrucomicrobiota bacterium]|jgi:hypothetical protein
MKQSLPCLISCLGLLFGAISAQAETVTEKWTRDYVPAAPPAEFRALASDAKGDVFILLADNSSGNMIYTAKYSGTDGHTIWEKTSSVAFDAVALVLDSQGNPAAVMKATGISGNPTDYFDYYTIKYRGSDGAVLWEKRHDNGFLDQPTAAVVNQAGDVIVTGGSLAQHGSKYNIDVYTVCYAAADGHVLWERRVNGAANDEDWGYAVTLDAAGNVFVTGTISYTASTGEDAYVGKYSGVDGHVIWETEKTLISGYDSGFFIKVDPQGNPVILGRGPGPGGFPDAFTTKYNGATGALIWNKSYDGPAHQNEYPGGLAIDGSGDVFVTIDSEAVNTGHDYYTAKYASANGAILWEKRFDNGKPAPGNNDEPRGLKLDASGNAIVTGEADTTNTMSEIYTVSYRNSDGAVVWEKRYPAHAHMTAETEPLVLTADGGFVINVLVVGKQVTVKYKVKLPNTAVNGVLGDTTLTVRHSARPNGSAASTEKAATAPKAPVADEFDAFLDFVAVQLSQVPGLEVQVQYSTLPSDHDSWFALENGNKGRLQRDPATGNFIAKSSHFPHIPNVYFRAKIKAPGFEEKFSNVVGPYDLSQKPQTLPPTGFRIFGEDRPCRVFAGQQLIFTAGQSSQASGLKVRVQYSFSPLVESSWTDLPNGTMSPEFNYYIVASNNYPTSDAIYFRAISSAPGAIDSISSYIGPWTLLNNDVPSVEINLPENQVYSRNSAVTIPVTATDANGIQRVELYVDGELYGLTSNAPYSFNIQGLEAGTHSLIAFAYDNSGAAGVSNVIEKIKLTDSRFTIYNRTSDGAWNDPAGWSPQHVPGVNDIVEISDGRTVSLNGAVSVRMLYLSGKLLGPGTLNVANQFSWVGGQLDSLTLNIATDAQFLCFSKANKSLTNVTVNNAGTLVVAGNGLDGNKGSSLNNTGKFTFAGQLAETAKGTIPQVTFGTVTHNGGLIRTAGGRLVAPNFNMNKGELKVGTHLIGNDGNTLIGNDGNTLIGNDGNSLIGNDGNSLIGNDGNSLIGNDGNTLIGNDGNSLIGNDGNTLVGHVLNGSGFISEHGGALISDNGAAFNFNGGAITGFGRIDYAKLNHTGGAFVPGNSPGAIDITGDYTQGPGASIVLEIGGTNGLAHDYDMLAIKGNAHLAGDLIVHSINGYQSAGFGAVPFGYGSVTGQFKSTTANAQVTLGTKGALVKVDGPNPPSPRALNISTRLQVQSGDNALFAGFIVTGPAGSTKKVMIRGIGPSLGQFGVSGTIPDPLLELHSSGPTVTNDSWQLAPNKNEIPAGFAPTDGRECVIIAALAPGDYSAILKGAHGEVGVGLAEVYDLDSASPAQLANIATRGLVQTDDNVLIGGFIIGGNEPAKVLVRAVGPSLSAFGIQGALQDPMLEVHDSNGGIITNDNWRETDEAAIASTTIPPSHDKEAAVLATLVPGNYTAVVRGKDNTTGIAVVQAYNLAP